MRLRWLLSVLFLFLQLQPLAVVAQEAPIHRIAFGSCASQERPQPIWQAIVATKPDLFIFLGDNIYGDTEDMEVMKAKYAKLAAKPGFQQLKQTCPIMATWDDHDYGVNDGGVDYPQRAASQQVFLDFFEEPADSPRRQRPGVYTAKTFGPEGKRVQVILLDTRSFRSPLKQGRRGYVPNRDPQATMLGEAQWQWLEEQLKKPAQFRIIGSSIQVVPEDHPYEKWMNLPNERERLFTLIRDTKAEGVIFLSGDRHLAELSLMDAGVGFPIYDLTSSGLNQAANRWRMQETNRHRVYTMNVGQNFGLLEFDWQTDPIVKLQIRDQAGDIVFQQKLKRSILQPGALPVQSTGPAKVIQGVLTPAQAATKLGDICTLRMRVQSVGQSRNQRVIFLNSAENYRDQANFTVVLLVEDLQGKIPNLIPDRFVGKTIQATGKVTRNDYGPRIEISDPNKLKVTD